MRREQYANIERAENSANSHFGRKGLRWIGPSPQASSAPSFFVAVGEFPVPSLITSAADLKYRSPLALGEHIGCYARLVRRQRLHQQIALQLGDSRPVLHVAVEIRRIDAPVFRRQTRDGAFHIADAGKMLVEARLIVARKLLLQRR